MNWIITQKRSNMANKVWVVVRERHTEDNDSTIILGVYDNEADAIERVNEDFHETEEEYIEQWGEQYSGENHHNGYAELHVDDAWDETRIIATGYEINKPTFDSIF